LQEKGRKNMNNAKSFDNKTDNIRRRTAESLESAADSVRFAGNESAGVIGDLANEAGKKLDSTATYVRTFAGGDALAGLRNSIRRNPMGSLALASAVGVLAGLTCRYSGRRSRHSAT
jgi:hypothetical protein